MKHAFIKISILTCLLLVTMLASLFAQETPTGFGIVPSSRAVTKFRYQLGGPQADAWIELDASDARIEFDVAAHAEKVLYLQQSSDDGGWSDSFQFRYEADAGSWVNMPAVRLDSVDTGVSLFWPQATYALLYDLGMGANLQVNLSLRDLERVRLLAGISYSYGESSTDWVESFHLVNLTVGIGYRIPLGERFEIIPELGYGLTAHFAYGDISGTGTPGMHSYLDQQARAVVRIVCEINAALGLYLAPTGMLFFEQGQMGSMVGFQTGLRINL